MTTFHYLHTAIATMRRRRSYRSELRRLLNTGDHLIKDAGLSTETVMREISKPTWKN